MGRTQARLRHRAQDRRGTYILAYFKADGRRIAGIEKDVLLSEKIMRVLILGTEKRPPELIEADIKGEPRVEPEGFRERGRRRAAAGSGVSMIRWRPMTVSRAAAEEITATGRA